MASKLLALGAGLSLLAGADAVRACAATSGYPWKIGDVRYDGADPKGNGNAIVAVSMSPDSGRYAAFFECVGEWPEGWAGFYQGGSNPVWADCIWAQNGPDLDNTVSFAMDWRNRTMYLSHTYSCSDRPGSVESPILSELSGRYMC